MKQTYSLCQLLFLLLGLTFLASCEKEKDDDNRPEENIDYGNGVIIGCEGGFNKGNADIFYYDYPSQTVGDELFKLKNGYPMGDVLQSIAEIDGSYYMVINNSQKITVINPNKLNRTADIKGFPSPRYIMKVPNTDKAYVTNYFSNELSIVDLKQNKIIKRINIGYYGEQLQIIQNKAFICCVKSNKVYVVDCKEDKVLDSITVGEEPQWCVLDKNDKLFVLCNYYNRTRPCELFLIEPSDFTVKKKITFQSSLQSPSRLAINGTRDTLYWIDRDVFRMGIFEDRLPFQPFYKAKPKANLYSIGIDPKNGDILVSDAKDYSSRGTVDVLNSQGIRTDSIRVGVIPSSFLFTHF